MAKVRVESHAVYKHRSEACSPQMMQGVSGYIDHKGFRT
jgi:hypothetical protein